MLALRLWHSSWSTASASMQSQRGTARSPSSPIQTLCQLSILLFAFLPPSSFQSLPQRCATPYAIDQWVVAFYRVTILYFIIRWGFNTNAGSDEEAHWNYRRCC